MEKRTQKLLQTEPREKEAKAVAAAAVSSQRIKYIRSCNTNTQPRPNTHTSAKFSIPQLPFVVVAVVSLYASNETQAIESPVLLPNCICAYLFWFLSATVKSNS